MDKEFSIEEKLSHYKDEISLRILLSTINEKEVRDKIKERIKEVTKNFIRCRWCGRSFGTLIKEKVLVDGEEKETGYYKHKNCEKDCREAIQNYINKM